MLFLGQIMLHAKCNGVNKSQKKLGISCAMLQSSLATRPDGVGNCASRLNKKICQICFIGENIDIFFELQN